MLNFASDLAGSLGLNCSELPNSCLGLQLLILEDVLDVIADRSLGLAKKLGELLLTEPDGLALKAHIQLGTAVFGLVDEDLAHGFKFS